MKVCLAFIILYHKNPIQLYRLIGQIAVHDSLIVIHVCKSVRKDEFLKIKKQYKDTKNIFFCKRENGAWGEFGIVQATINALKLLIFKSLYFDYVSLISAQDYPIKPLHEFQTFLTKNCTKEFITVTPFYPFENCKRSVLAWQGRQSYRIDRHYIKIGKYRFQIPNVNSSKYISHSVWDTVKNFIYQAPKIYEEGKLINELLELILSRILPTKRNFPFSIKLYAGSQWWTITKEAAEYIVRVDYKFKRFKRFLKRSLLPDEYYFQTVLMHSPFAGSIVNNNLRMIEFKGSHPILYTENDLNLLKSNNAFFARKFDINKDSKILDLLDTYTLK